MLNRANKLSDLNDKFDNHSITEEEYNDGVTQLYPIDKTANKRSFYHFRVDDISNGDVMFFESIKAIYKELHVGQRGELTVGEIIIRGKYEIEYGCWDRGMVNLVSKGVLKVPFDEFKIKKESEADYFRD